MAGPTNANEVNWKPTIIVTCWDKQQQKVIEKKLRQFPDYTEGYEKRVETEKDKRCSGERGTAFLEKGLSEYIVKGQVPETLTSLCGMLCRIEEMTKDTLPPSKPASSSIFTLGGLIQVNDALYALSAAHALLVTEDYQAPDEGKGELTFHTQKHIKPAIS